MKEVSITSGMINRINPWKMLIWLLITQIMVAFIGRSLGPLGILIGEDFSLTKAQIGILPAALFLGQALASIPAGFLVDRLGSRLLLMMAAAITGISFIILTVNASYWILIVLIVLAGAGYGSMHPVSNRGIIYWFKQRQRGTAMGIKQMGITLGSALAGLLLLPLAASYGWRPVLGLAAAALVFTGCLAYINYKDPVKIKEKDPNQSIKAFYISLLKMTKNKPLVYVSVSALFLNGSQMCLNTYIVLYAYEKIGLSLFMAGILFVISEVSGSFGRIGWGIISDRLFDGKRVIILIFIAILTAGASLMIAFIPEGTSFTAIAPIVMVFGFAVSGFNGIWMNLASELVPKEQAGLSSGFSIMVGSLGVIMVPPFFGFMVDQTGSYTTGWVTISSFMGLVLFFLLLLSKKNNN
ncbi:MFS transporter [Jeotgalibacillus proteolyticus]|uniref:MFS transporter n=1 Tax=Jeotgalibacillus proteolyticus TaxID=2082395 RepID=A0A2S5G7Q8_9BACL|nr:MFS transporter [Jeotgalibacillus proteolyticus]PPA69027.1 MFS transporter [Jeotgalibacillus proteolyticus]